MKLTEIEALIHKVRYKPGWSIFAEPDAEWNDAVVWVQARVRDSRARRARYLTITSSRWITRPSSMTRARVLRLISAAIDELEEHEFGEWLVVGRQRPFDPH